MERLLTLFQILKPVAAVVAVTLVVTVVKLQGVPMTKAMKKEDPRRTTLTGRHEALSANMTDFAGYLMPVWYPTGVKKEHIAVVTAAGLFDTSHMAVLTVSGQRAIGLLQQCFTKDLNACDTANHLPLTPGRSVYGAFLDTNGHVIDDSIISCVGRDNFLVVVNAGMGPRIARHLEKQIEICGFNAVITDFTNRLGKIDIQGPTAARILSKVIKNPADVFKDMAYFSFKGYFDPQHLDTAKVLFEGGYPVLISRTGYTGEFGFELIMDAGCIVNIWDMLLDAGESLGLIPCGLGARDSLRAGAVLPLSHQDIGAWPFVNHPWSFALPWNPDRTAFTKAFIGDRALLSAISAPHTHAFVGDSLQKVSTSNGARVLDAQETPIGEVLTCATDMAIGRLDGHIMSVVSPGRPADFNPRGLCCGFVKIDRKLPPGTRVILEDSRRRIEVTIVNDVRPHRTAKCPIQQML
jgi:aminomethyltransferase